MNVLSDNNTKMNHGYDEPKNFIERYAAHFDINGPRNVTEMVPVIATECMESCIRRRHTRIYLKAIIASSSTVLPK